MLVLWSGAVSGELLCIYFLRRSFSILLHVLKLIIHSHKNSRYLSIDTRWISYVIIKKNISGIIHGGIILFKITGTQQHTFTNLKFIKYC